MKRWQAILLNTILAISFKVIELIPDKSIQEISRLAVEGVVLASIAYVTHKASESNPDGTSARAAWLK